jgi:hypothetical protein
MFLTQVHSFQKADIDKTPHLGKKMFNVASDVTELVASRPYCFTYTNEEEIELQRRN